MVGRRVLQAASSAAEERTPADGFREAMSQLATGVVLVTSCVEGRPWGMTVSACCPVCVEPATLLVSLAQRTVLAKAIARNRTFGVSVLGQGAIDIARFGASSGAPKFLDDVCSIADGDRGTAVVEGSLSHIDCDLDEVVPYGDHVLNLGRVRSIRLTPGDKPLVYYARDYRSLGMSA